MFLLGGVGVGDVLPFNPEILDLVMKRAQEVIIKKQARLEGMRTLRENGVKKSLKGVTTLEEVTRLTIADK